MNQKIFGQELRHPLYFFSFFQSTCMEVFPILHCYKNLYGGFYNFTLFSTVFTVLQFLLLHLCKTSLIVHEPKNIQPGASPPIVFFQFSPICIEVFPILHNYFTLFTLFLLFYTVLLVYTVFTVLHDAGLMLRHYPYFMIIYHTSMWK